MNETYNYRALSPKDFEDLVADLLAAEHSCSVHTFKAGPDGGIDLKAVTPKGVRLIGQAKHYIGSSFSDLKRACAQENERAKSIGKACDQYILATTQSLSNSQKQELLGLLADLPISEADLLAADDISSLLRKHNHVERAHFKLWLSGTATLERLLYGRLYSQSDGEIEAIENEMFRFVRHEGVDKAYSILRKNGRLIISGPPGIGKTTLARMVCSLHISDGWELSVAHSVEEVGDALGLDGQRVILFDDFLGQVRLSDALLQDVDSRLPAQLQRAINSKNVRLIITTRDYILRGAQSRSEKLARSIHDDETFILSLDKYSFLDRARILYNHIFFSDLSKEEVNAFVENGFYKEVVDHENYNPRIIKTITDADYTRLSPNEIQGEIRKILDKPELLWSTPFHEHISDASQLLAITVAIRSWRRAKGVPISEAQDAFSNLNGRLGYSIKAPRIYAEFKKAVKHLEGNFLAISDGHFALSNPGVRDFLEEVIIESGIAQKLLETTVTTGELVFIRNLSADFIKAHSRLWYKAYERIYRDDDYISLSELGAIIEAFRLIDPTLSEKEHRTFLVKIYNSYLSNEDFDGEFDGIGSILLAIDDSLIEEETTSAVLSHIERELEFFVEQHANSGWTSSMEDTEWIVLKFYEHSCITNAMKSELANLIERTLDHASHDFTQMSDEDVIRERDLADELEGYLREAPDWQYSDYTDAYNRELEERSARDQHEEDMYRDGYYSSPSRSVGDAPGTQPSNIAEDQPMDDAEKAHSMFRSLRLGE